MGTDVVPIRTGLHTAVVVLDDLLHVDWEWNRLGVGLRCHSDRLGLQIETQPLRQGKLWSLEDSSTMVRLKLFSLI